MPLRFLACLWLVAAPLVQSPAAAQSAARHALLIDAVKAEDAAAARTLLARTDIDVNAVEPDGTTALHWAVHFNDEALVNRLIDAGAKVRVANRFQMTPLALAAINGNARVIERLLKAGATANDTIAEGETALMTAARSDRAEAVRVLLAHGAKVNAREARRGQMALHWAAARGNAAVVTMLLEAGADVNAKTPSVIHKHSNDEDNYSKPAQVGGQTGWDWEGPEASEFSALTFAVREGERQMVQILLDAGANVNDALSDGTSALCLAIENHHYDLAAYLLDRGADPNSNGQGWTALHQVVRGRRANTRGYTAPVPTGHMPAIELIEKLLAKGAHINARIWNNVMMTRDGQRQRFNYMGATPFLVAAKISDLEVMRLLLARGANPHLTNVENQTALMVAAGVALFNPGEDAGSNPEHMAERLQAVKFCVEQLGQDVNAVSRENETALHGAVYLGHSRMVEYLVSRGATLDIKNDRGWTPLMIANGAAWAEFYKEYPEVAVVLRRLMAERGLATENQIGDQVTCKDCYLTRAEEAFRRMEHDRKLQKDLSLVTALKAAR